MKKFTKLFLSCAAVAAVTAAVATSAMAADSALKSATYDAATSTVTATLPENAPAATTRTVLILNKGIDRANISDPQTAILGINQGTADEVSSVKIKALDATADAGTYNVYIGGEDGAVYAGSFKIGTSASGVLMGDVTDSLSPDTLVPDGEIDLADATAVVKHSVKAITLTGDVLAAADVADSLDASVKAGDGEVDLADATAIVKYSVKATTGTGIVGETK